jgi:predicted Zn-ribbon and HTH transcriptional regulator
MAKETKSKGRPKGSPNREIDQVDAPASTCPKCGSTKRGPYFNRRDLPYAGTCQATGQVYTSIVIRRCECSDCGQFRDDRQLVNEPSAEAA